MVSQHTLIDLSEFAKLEYTFSSSVVNYSPGRVSCTPGSYVPGHEWQPGSHSGLSGLAFPVSASCSLPFDQGRGKKGRQVETTRLVTASTIHTVGAGEGRRSARV